MIYHLDRNELCHRKHSVRSEKKRFRTAKSVENEFYKVSTINFRQKSYNYFDTGCGIYSVFEKMLAEIYQQNLSMKYDGRLMAQKSSKFSHLHNSSQKQSRIRVRDRFYSISTANLLSHYVSRLRWRNTSLVRIQSIPICQQFFIEFVTNLLAYWRTICLLELCVVYSRDLSSYQH